MKDTRARRASGAAALDKWASTRGIAASQSVIPSNPASSKITTVDGKLFFGGKSYRGVFINAHDLFLDYLTGGNNYITDLPTIAASNIKLIRVIAAPYIAADWTTYVGTNATSPVTGYLTKLRTFLDAAQAVGIGVELSLFWGYAVLPAVLSETVTAYQNSASATRTYIRAFAQNMALNFSHHPALAAWNIGNEYFNVAQIAKFATATTDTTIDHIQLCADVHSEIVTAIRKYDPERAIFSAGGGGGFYEGHSLKFWVRKMIASAGSCDVVVYHPYANTWRTSFPQFGTGYDYAGLDIIIPVLRQACIKAGKVLVIDECAADDDSGQYGTPVGQRALACYTKCHAAGVELVGDWGWYANATSSLPDLKTTRNPVMNIIATQNASVKQDYIAPVQPYIHGRNSGVFPTRCASGTGTTNSYLRIPLDSSMQPSGTAGEAFYMMFWLRKKSVLATTTRIFSSSDGSGGMVLSPTADEGLSYSIFFTAGVATLTPVSFGYPADQALQPNPTFCYPNEWQHIVIQWDSTVRNESYNDGKQHVDVWINGIQTTFIPITATKIYKPSTRDLYFLSSSDGTSSYATADIADIITGKSYLTCEMVKNYVTKGMVPASANHRWKLDGNVTDSIGTLNAIAGANLQFINSGL